MLRVLDEPSCEGKPLVVWLGTARLGQMLRSHRRNLLRNGESAVLSATAEMHKGPASSRTPPGPAVTDTEFIVIKMQYSRRSYRCRNRSDTSDQRTHRKWVTKN